MTVDTKELRLLGSMARGAGFIGADRVCNEAAVEVERLTAQVKAAKRQGYVEGVTAFAWWKDGVQYVGTCGTTLDAALAKPEPGKEKSCPK